MVTRGSGKIVNIGSISGVLATPYSGVYCASKAAFHSLSDALRLELRPFGVDVMVVAPGAIQSNFATKSQGSDHLLPEGSFYTAAKEEIEKTYDLTKDGTPTRTFAKATVSAILAPRNRPYFFFGKLATIVPFLKNWLPIWLSDRILKRRYGLDKLGPITK